MLALVLIFRRAGDSNREMLVLRELSFDAVASAGDVRGKKV